MATSTRTGTARTCGVTDRLGSVASWAIAAQLALFSLVVPLGGCVAPAGHENVERGESDLAGLQTVAIDLPPLVAAENVALVANLGLTIGDRTRTLGSNGGLATTVNMGTQPTTVNPDARLGNLYSRGTIELRDRARVSGSVFTTTPVTLRNGAGIGGLTFPNFVFTPSNRVQWQVDVPTPNTTDVKLEPDQQATVAPGRYRTISVKSRSTVTFSTGEYFIDALEVLEPDAAIRINESAGPVKLYVSDKLVFRGQLRNVSNAAVSDLLVVVFGTTPIILERPFSGYLFVPNATIEFRETVTPHNGAFFARQIVTNAGAVIQHRPFRFTEFFPPVLVLGPKGVTPHDPAVGVDGGDLGVDLGLPEGQRACDPGLVLESELDGIQPDSSLAFRDTPTAPRSCVVDFQQCTDAEAPATDPTTEELNEQPPLGAKCTGTAERVDCGINPETIAWDDEFGLCATDADCVLFGKVCARVCLKAGCTGNADCVDPTCANDVEMRCAKRSTICAAQPTEGPCQEIRECAEQDASGNSDPRAHELTGMPPSNIDEPPAETPPATAVPPSRPTTYQSEASYCNAPAPPTINADLQPEPEERDMIAGNDKWGIIAQPKMTFEADANPTALGGQAAIVAKAEAGLEVAVRLWGKDYPVFLANGVADFATCKAELSRSLVLVGFDIDPGAGDQTANDRSSECNSVLTALGNRFSALRAAQAKALETKKFTDCVGPRTSSNAAAWNTFCQSALQAIQAGGAGETEGFAGFPVDCSSANAGPLMAAAWVDLYRHLRDKEVEALAGLANIRNSVLGSIPNSPLNFLDIDKQFTGFHFDFTYPVGPITVSIELELVGGWGISGALEYSAAPPPNTRIQAQASLRPRFDSSVIIFAGVGIGPVVVGIEGNLLLLSVQTPLHTGVTLKQRAVPDERTTFYPASAGYAFTAPTSAPAGYVPFGPTLYDWDAEWTYGAGAHLESLSGQIDLAAKIKLLFFTKKFKKKLAKWDALFTMDKAFTGSLSASGQQLILSPVGGEPSFGTFFETIPFVNPTYIANTTLAPRSNTCQQPSLGPCVIIQ